MEKICTMNYRQTVAAVVQRISNDAASQPIGGGGQRNLFNPGKSARVWRHSVKRPFASEFDL
jgi:hypothetical protein